MSRVFGLEKDARACRRSIKAAFAGFDFYFGGVDEHGGIIAWRGALGEQLFVYDRLVRVALRLRTSTTGSYNVWIVRKVSTYGIDCGAAQRYHYF